MIFAAPALLLALLALPLLWWLLRVVPPSPRQVVFPAVRLLLGLGDTAQTAARTPPWLMALRMLAASLVIVGLAGPVLRAGRTLPGRGPVLLVVDDGWASAPLWAAAMRSADAALDRAARAGRTVALLTTAPAEDGTSPRIGPLMPPAELRPILAVLRPKPWAVDRAAAGAALAGWARDHHGGAAYVGDGLTDGGQWGGFATALRAAGPVSVFAPALPPARLLLPPVISADGLTARVLAPRRPVPVQAAVLAQSSDGRTLARLPLTIAAGAAQGEAKIRLPSEVRNQIDRLVLASESGDVAGAGGVALIDASSRTRPVGLLDADAGAETPLAGPDFFLARALAPFADVRTGSIASLLAGPLSVLVLADQPLVPGDDADRLTKFVRDGGLLLRFAGPAMAQGPVDEVADPLLPAPLLASSRDLGGAMSWSEPAALAPFPAGSPFAGLPIPADVRVTRQVLADPSADLTQAIWARLADGTPLVTQRALGEGRIVLFHVTANADWSNLPISGLFVDMLRRLVALSAGVAGTVAEPPGTLLAPSEILDGDGVLGPPPPTATAILASALAATRAGPAHPPGLYGPENARRALDLAPGLPAPEASPAIAGAAVEPIGAAPRERPIGPWLLALAVLLLAADLVLSLRLRGLLETWRWRAGATLIVLALLGPVASGIARAEESNPALATRLAYVATGDAALDEVSRSGLAGLSAFVNSRTAAVLADPAAVVPGRDDLSFYPLLYWPISADVAPLGAPGVAALNDFMAHGGIILIDTRDGGSGEGMASGARDVLRRLGRGAGALQVPALAPLTSAHVLARSFYLLSEFPGRYAGDTVWVDRDADSSNDGVSPIIIGAHDWAAAWATDPDGRHPYATMPGGDRQRLLAYRFGVNVVMYALTGNYKGDQVHVPALLERLGQ